MHSYVHYKDPVSHGQTAIFLQGVMAFSINAHKNTGSGVISIAKLFLTPPSRLKVLKCLLSVPQCLKMAQEFNTSRPTGGVKFLSYL